MKNLTINTTKRTLIIATAVFSGFSMLLKAEQVSAQSKATVVTNANSLKIDTVKTDFYEPGLNIPSKSTLYLDMKYDKTADKTLPVNKRLLYVNGKEITAGNAGDVDNAKLIILLDDKKAIAKYGEKAKFGAIEVVGENVEILTLPE